MRRSEGAAGPDRGYVTAEAALVIPALVLFVGLLVWALSAVAVSLRCGDAARVAARAAARSESPATVAELARAAGPARARVTVEREGELWRVTVRAPAPGPVPLPGGVSGRAVAWAEDEIGTAGEGRGG
ncbi:TadE family type IV pilus minor pilin [Streptomyces sp. BI20]|uniref:TadE family type IV pilus minor pilin n=1 Tax=Streptomyces sp. BI20 TaxID=3403460 RepID=UPI003C76B327